MTMNAGAENVSNNLDPRHRYYEYFGKKISASVYAMDYYSLTERLKLMGNLQFRFLRYEFDQTPLGALPGYDYNINWTFLSPRAGITYLPTENSDVHISFAVASREPADVSIYDAEEITAFPNLAIEDYDVTPGGEYQERPLPGRFEPVLDGIQKRDHPGRRSGR